MVKRFLTILATLAIMAMSITTVSAVEPSNPRDAANLEPADVGPVSSIDREQKPNLGTGSEPRRYLVRLQDPAVPSYEGDKPGLTATSTRGVEKLDADSAPVAAYREPPRGGPDRVRHPRGANGRPPGRRPVHLPVRRQRHGHGPDA